MHRSGALTCYLVLHRYVVDAKAHSVPLFWAAVVGSRLSPCLLESGGQWPLSALPWISRCPRDNRRVQWSQQFCSKITVLCWKWCRWLRAIRCMCLSSRKLCALECVVLHCDQLTGAVKRGRQNVKVCARGLDSGDHQGRCRWNQDPADCYAVART